MEAAPLTLAHTHARNAVLETRKSNPVAASEEHDLAAGEFATAAQSCSDREALRTLQLLEQHHKSLAHILRFHHEHPSSDMMPEISSPAAMTDMLTTGPGTSKTPSSAQDAQQQPPRLSGNARLPQRDTSSIASNLASARGIPSHPRRSSPVSPALSSQQAGAKMTGPPSEMRAGDSAFRAPQPYATKDRTSRTSAAKQPWTPPTASPTTATSQQAMSAGSVGARKQKDRYPTDESFQRFYSTFEGLISKLSAPLAFAGLPLGSEDPGQVERANRKSPADTKLDRHHATRNLDSPPTEPDVNRLYSRAALRAIRESNGGNANTTESFYVVPTTGGTVSYAGILNRAEREARRSSIEEADEDFVDARETPSSPELRHSGGGTKPSRLSRDPDKFTGLQNPKTMEELQMENQALKHLSDTLSKRLHMWEVNAQSSSIALQQSLKAMHQQSTTSPEHLPQHPTGPTPVATVPGASAPGDYEQRIKYLEDDARRSAKELDQLSRENEKLKSVLGRYRERWEKLKEGAKTRRAEARNGIDNNASAGPAAAKSPDNVHEQEGESPILNPEGESENDNTNEPSSRMDLPES